MTEKKELIDVESMPHYDFRVDRHSLIEEGFDEILPGLFEKKFENDEHLTIVVDTRNDEVQLWSDLFRYAKAKEPVISVREEKEEEKQQCRARGGVWDDYHKECRIVRETPEQILNRVWRIYDKNKCKKSKPDITFRRQHATALYWPKRNLITIREDSWNKMHPAERRLTVIHETLHACGIPHREGFRTSQDYTSPIIYKRIWGDDFVIGDYINKIKESINKYVVK